MFTIEKIEGNSGLGVPVFSKFGQMRNYDFIAMSPLKLEREDPDGTTDTYSGEELKKFEYQRG